MLLEQPGTSNTVQCSIGFKCSWTNHLQQIQRSAVLGLNSAGQPTTAVIEQCSTGLLHQLVQPATQQVHSAYRTVQCRVYYNWFCLPQPEEWKAYTEAYYRDEYSCYNKYKV